MRTITIEQEGKIINEIDPRYKEGYKIHKNHARPAQTMKEWKQARNVTMTILMLDTGIRVGEIVQLGFYDLWFQGEAVHTLQISRDIAKGKRERDVPLTARAIITLNRWFILTNFIPYSTSQFPAFPNRPGGGLLTTRTVERIISAAAQSAAGIIVTPHMLRHTFATRLMKITNIRTVQELLGHKNLASTQIYTHVNDDDKQKAITDMVLHNSGVSDTTLLSHLPGHSHNNLTAPGTNRGIR